MSTSELPDSAEGTDAVLRRSMAGLVDFALVAGPWFVLLRMIAVRFSFERDVFGVPLFDAVDQQQVDRLEAESNWALQLGDSLYYLPGSRLWLAVVVLVALVAAVFIAIPVNTEGRSIGKKIFGLQTVTIEGFEPTPVDYLLRTVGGIVDAAPIVLPGLLGWFLAWRHLHHQRLGDRLAGTVVIDLLAPLPRPGAARHSNNHEQLTEPLEGLESPPPPIPMNAIDKPGPDTSDADMTVVNIEARLGLDDGSVATRMPTVDSPIWSDEWDAWLYWDLETEQWFGHNPETDDWSALPDGLDS